jgi:protease-4
MIWKSQLLAVWPLLSGQVEQLAEMPRSERRADTLDRAPRGNKVGFVELVGVLDPDYMASRRAQLAALAADSSVAQIVLYISSPGGTVNGTADLGAVVRKVAGVKPVHAIVEDFCCSAAYWAASQCTSITASPSALLGSIGSYIVLVDDSALFEKIGVKVLVIASGSVKGIGVPGVKVETEQIAMIRRLVDTTGRSFQSAVARGRALDSRRVSDLSTGEVWYAQEAKNLGLIDRVSIFEDRLAELQRATPAEKYAELAGRAAVDKWEELVAAETGGPDAEYDADAEEQAERKLTKKYPMLAAAAKRP